MANLVFPYKLLIRLPRSKGQQRLFMALTIDKYALPLKKKFKQCDEMIGSL